MSTVGQIEKKTQNRIVALFRDRLHYDYLGDRSGQDNRNINPELLTAWLHKRKENDALIKRALHKLTQAESDTSKHLYARNKEVYDLLRYGLKVQPEAGENNATVFLVDWKNPRTIISPSPKR